MKSARSVTGPRRAGSFEPQLLRKGQRRLGGIDKIVLWLYARP